MWESSSEISSALYKPLEQKIIIFPVPVTGNLPEKTYIPWSSSQNLDPKVSLKELHDGHCDRASGKVKVPCLVGDEGGTKASSLLEAPSSGRPLACPGSGFGEGVMHVWMA
ncbi:hypothetical protein DV515_00007742 [Chloebia gouldiae]|uniref:Uncharacterized protein n=1 Tax=Chloebia gouldiae TaxID=44316 RepID=A0A3L8SHQ3_CHLGU|nr:hypothetical protein DV515_00007742 [Chloebia gouldiae]